MGNDRLSDSNQDIPKPCGPDYNPGGEKEAMAISQLGGRKMGDEFGNADRNVRKF